MFGGIARRYDLLNHLLSGWRDVEWRRRTVGLVEPEGPVLDVCCGTGDLALAWSERLGPDRTVCATDFCQEMLVLFGGKIRRRGLGRRVLTAAGDTLRIPFPDDTFGAVSVAFGIRNVADLRGGIREMARVARPGGRVLILEFTMPTNLVFRSVYLLYFLLVLPFIGNLVSGTRENAYGYLPRSVLRFPGRARLKAIMEEEGLEEVRIENLSLGIVNVLVGRKPGGARG